MLNVIRVMLIGSCNQQIRKIKEMPTGYTYKVSEDKDYMFEDFIWDCARAFGALMHMRDDNQDAKIVMPEQTSYYQDSVEQHTKELARLKKLSMADAKKEMIAEFDAQYKRAKEGIEAGNATRQRYEKMLSKVSAWRPPTSEHEDLKRFMLEQLNSSIQFDCHGDYYERMLDEKMPTAEKWLKDSIKEEQSRLDYALVHLEKEKTKYTEQVEWITQLKKSVPIPQKKNGL